ncbi:acyl-CoA Delta(11) desaturase [Agrilus planipennis]|uniref:Acyl-CoA Delta(11) desaturase n=1 Tax=Agrilus planipennis TaxID=224129 RepID=A0A7F5QYU2_AGRPL|nr:acyl-CoA Delta(11) desaturase [Agrilus planipennis]
MGSDRTISDTENHQKDLDWIKVLFYIHVHVLMVCGLFMVFLEASILTTLFSIVLTVFGILGVTAGAHRLWAHQSYVAEPGLKVFLMLCQTLAGQGTIYDWVRVHRLHHKYFATEKDPFNPSRGFWYAHIKGLLKRPSATHEKLLNEVDMSDIEKDNVVMFQKKFYWLIFIIVSIVLPLNTPIEYWNENFFCTLFVAGALRYGLTQNFAWFIHSGSRLWGLQKDEKNPPDSNIVFFITKSYWPQYHYIAPWDYRTTEFGGYANGCTTAFIRIFAALGWAYNLKTIDSDGVRKALALSVETGKKLPDVLKEVAENQPLSDEHVLEPKKFL